MGACRVVCNRSRSRLLLPLGHLLSSARLLHTIAFLPLHKRCSRLTTVKTCTSSYFLSPLLASKTAYLFLKLYLLLLFVRATNMVSILRLFDSTVIYAPAGDRPLSSSLSRPSAPLPGLTRSHSTHRILSRSAFCRPSSRSSLRRLRR